MILSLIIANSMCHRRPEVKPTNSAERASPGRSNMRQPEADATETVGHTRQRSGDGPVTWLVTATQLLAAEKGRRRFELNPDMLVTHSVTLLLATEINSFGGLRSFSSRRCSRSRRRN